MDILNVDYGTKQIVYRYSAKVNREDTYKQRGWCEERFKDYAWRQHGLAFYFTKKKDLVLFLLRWA